MEAYTASRDQLVWDIEIKLTNYLHEYNHNVDEEQAMLHQSTTEISEYQAELMVAAKEDEGAIMRIKELERRGAIAESGAQRIYEKGMSTQSEYKDEIHQRQGLLSSAESRLHGANENSEYAQSIAQRLFHGGREMQAQFENSIMEYQQQFMLADASSSHLAIANMQNSEEMQSMTSEIIGFQSALSLANKKAELYESNMEQVVRESKRKVHEANQAKNESDLHFRNAEHEVARRLLLGGLEHLLFSHILGIVIPTG